MKKLLITLVLLFPFVTGCADIETRVNINNDKSANVVSSITYKGDLSSLTDDTSVKFSNTYDKFLDSSYKVEKAYGAQFSTITATKSISNIERENLDLSSLGLKTQLPDGKFIDVKKNFFITSYNINATYDYPTQAKNIQEFLNAQEVKNEKSIENMSPEYFQKYAEDILPEVEKVVEEQASTPEQKENQTKNSKLNTTFEIKVPGFASFNNADKVDGFTYIWNIKQNGITEIKLQYVTYSGLAITLMILVGVLLLILLSKKILKHDAQKRIDNVNNIV
jgi:hypothetical protein